ncbi:ArsC family reductase [Enterobacteriaceae bacterium LUAb1]
MTIHSPRQSLYTLYGIKNCDTCKKARHYLAAHNIAYHFHDYRVDGLNETLLQHAIDTLGWKALLNTRGTTWRQRSEAERATVNSAETAKVLMLAYPSLIKRPLICRSDGSLLLGFNEDNYRQFFQEES